MKGLINRLLREGLLYNGGGEYTFYHGTNDEFGLDKIDERKGLWLTPDINYAKVWGGKLYEVKVKLGKILDTYSDVGKKKKTLFQWVKYLDSKGVDTEDFVHAQKIDKYDDEKFMFWSLISNHKHISYSWLKFDISHSGYDAISVFEYGYSYREKSDGGTILILKPKESIISITEVPKDLNEGELKRSNFKTEWEYQEAYYNQKNSKLKKFAIKSLDELVKVEGAGTYELFRGSKDGNQNIGAGIYAYGIHYTNDIETANEFGNPTNFKVKLKNPKIVDAANVKSDGLHAEERTNVLKSEGYDSLVVRHKKIYTVYGNDMIYELPYIEYEVIKF